MSSYLRHLTKRWLLHLVVDFIALLAVMTAVLILATWTRSPAVIILGVAAVLSVLVAAVVRAAARTRGLLVDAYTDPLSGLPTRAVADHLMDGRDTALAAVTTTALADADGLKEVNTSFGHPVGDRYLTVIAHRLRNAVADHGTVVRLGGDEFLIVTDQGPEALAAAIDSAMVSAWISEYNIWPTVSVGIAVGAAVGGLTAGVVRADAALHTAKRYGGGRTLVYDPRRDGQTEQGSARRWVRRRNVLASRPPVSGRTLVLRLTLGQAHTVRRALRIAAMSKLGNVAGSGPGAESDRADRTLPNDRHDGPAKDGAAGHDPQPDLYRDLGDQLAAIISLAEGPE